MSNWRQIATGQKPQNQTASGGATTPLNGILQLVGSGIGAVGGGAAGAAGGALIPGADLTGVPEAVGGYAGEVAGSGAGAAGGNQVADWLNQLLFNKQQNPQQQVQGDVNAAKAGAIGQAIGGPLAKGAGAAFHPIETLSDQVDRILGNSPKTIDFGDAEGGLMNKFNTQVVPKLNKDLLGPEVPAIKQNIQSRITGALAETPREDPITGTKVPIKNANDIKKALYALVGNHYGAIGTPEQEAIKGMGGLTKQAIESAEPGVGKYNATMSKLYSVPDLLNELAKIPGVGGIEKVSGLPLKTAQAVIPKGGSYLNVVLPRLMQLLAGASQSQ